VNDAGLRRPIRQEIDQPSCPQILLNDEGWKLTDTDAAQRCEAKRHHIFRDEAWPVPDCARLGSADRSAGTRGRANPCTTDGLVLQLGGILGFCHFLLAMERRQESIRQRPAFRRP
jgi:hypothetical protein